jgi:hypothetical protein
MDPPRHVLRSRIPRPVWAPKPVSVQLWGDWNTWQGPVAHGTWTCYNYWMVGARWWVRPYWRGHAGPEVCVEAVVPKTPGTHEFKWRVVFEDGSTCWYVDPDRRVAHNEGWNANSVIVFGAGRRVRGPPS